MELWRILSGTLGVEVVEVDSLDTWGSTYPDGSRSLKADVLEEVHSMEAFDWTLEATVFVSSYSNPVFRIRLEAEE